MPAFTLNFRHQIYCSCGPSRRSQRMAEFGPWTRLDYEAAPPQDFEGATEAAPPPSKRATSKGAASRTTATTPTPRVASTVANAGSTNGFGSTAPFGSATSRFSPSMSMAHHVPGHKPHIAGATTARGSKPNTRWVPQALRVEEPAPPPPPPPPPPSSSNSLASDGSSSSRRRAAAATGVGAVVGVGAASFGRPRSAAEELRISRKLRAEISALRDAKLAQLRGEGGGSPDEPEGPCRRPGGAASQRSPRTVGEHASAHHGAASQRSPRTVVSLDGRVLQRCVPVGEHASAHHGAPCPRVLERYVPVGEHVPPVRRYIPLSDAEGAREISMEYAELLAFVAGESRTR